jgi:ubiquinone/menaquinone biosynthesis C-methylase UbiE
MLVNRPADIGCGSGGQTMVLAQHTAGRLTGVDLFPLFIELFNQNATLLGLQDRVQGVVESMDQLSFKDEELDLIWSEGAIYHIGFQRGLAEWKRFLKTGGFIAVTEVSWFTEERPSEINDFWLDAYPEIDTIPRKVAQMQQAGYLPVATFVLPENLFIQKGQLVLKFLSLVKKVAHQEKLFSVDSFLVYFISFSMLG